MNTHIYKVLTIIQLVRSLIIGNLFAFLKKLIYLQNVNYLLTF